MARVDQRHVAARESRDAAGIGLQTLSVDEIRCDASRFLGRRAVSARLASLHPIEVDEIRAEVADVRMIRLRAGDFFRPGTIDAREITPHLIETHKIRSLTRRAHSRGTGIRFTGVGGGIINDVGVINGGVISSCGSNSGVIISCGSNSGVISSCGSNSGVIISSCGSNSGVISSANGVISSANGVIGSASYVIGSGVGDDVISGGRVRAGGVWNIAGGSGGLLGLGSSCFLGGGLVSAVWRALLALPRRHPGGRLRGE